MNSPTASVKSSWSSYGGFRHRQQAHRTSTTGRHSPLRINRFTSHRTASPVMSATAADGSMTCDQKPLPHGISGAQSPKASTIKRMVKIGRVMSNDMPQPHLPPRVPPPRYLPSSIRRYYQANECPLVASTNRPASGNFWSLARRLLVVDFNAIYLALLVKDARLRCITDQETVWRDPPHIRPRPLPFANSGCPMIIIRPESVPTAVWGCPTAQHRDMGRISCRRSTIALEDYCIALTIGRGCLRGYAVFTCVRASAG